MTIRFDAPLRSNTTQFGVNSLGVIGSSIPSTGTHGPSIIYNNLNLPAEDNDEFRVRIVTPPVGLTTFSVGEDGSVLADGLDGTYSGIYEGFKNGVSYGFSTFSLTIGTALGMLRDMNQSFSGKRLLTTPQVGVIATSIPSTGTDGPPYAYNDLVFPADNNKLVRGFITSFPSQGTMIAEDDTSFTFSGAPNGSYQFTYQLFLDDISQGTASGWLDVGNPTTSLVVTLEDIIEAFDLSAGGVFSTNTTLADVTASFSGSADSGASTSAIVLSDVTTSISGNANTVSIAASSIILENEVLSVSVISDTGAAVGNIVLSGVTTNFVAEGDTISSFQINTILDDTAESTSVTGETTSLAVSLIVLGNTLVSAEAVGDLTSQFEINSALDDVSTSLSVSGGSRPASIATILENVTTSMMATGETTSIAGFNTLLQDNSVALYAISIHASVSTDTTLADVTTSLQGSGNIFLSTAFIDSITENTVFAGSAGNSQTIPAEINTTLEDVGVSLTGFGSRPPNIVGPNARLPISLGITLDGQLIILC
jgi:hypothetical protein